MYIAFLVLLVIWIIVTCIHNNLRLKKSKDKPKDVIDMGKAKFNGYVRAIIFLWGSALVVLIMSFIGNISFTDLGFRPISFSYNVWFTAITLVVCGLAFVYFIWALISSLRNKKVKEKQATDSVTEKALPGTTRERKLFFLVNFSSAICEELIFRGFTAFLLQAVFPGIPIFLIILITGVVFGLSHLYQGLEGVIETGIVGVILMSLFLASGSLILPMLLHFFGNLPATFMRSEEQSV
ncbi:MAG: CPBP family intramembrane metalloprotease [Defluviitaleaceae bacterium]|nr:CPBP family intramembrane metalloprotease [Defluviitaleaceae bacterium]